jgi:Cytochrome bd terminal oxidase subunit I
LQNISRRRATNNGCNWHIADDVLIGSKVRSIPFCFRACNGHGSLSGTSCCRPLVGLAAYIAVLECLHLMTGREAYARISAFWTKIFAVSFAMGVVSGIVRPFQFGANWSRFTDATPTSSRR